MIFLLASSSRGAGLHAAALPLYLVAGNQIKAKLYKWWSFHSYSNIECESYSSTQSIAWKKRKTLFWTNSWTFEKLLQNPLTYQYQFILFSGLSFHFWIVRLSLYRSMTQSDRPNYMGHELNEIRTYVYTVWTWKIEGCERVFGINSMKWKESAWVWVWVYDLRKNHLHKY